MCVCVVLFALDLIKTLKKSALGKFRQFDYGLLNLIRYGTLEPPNYELSQVTSPVAIFYAASDHLSSPKVIFSLLKYIYACEGN